jgi:hypothetical protein
MKGWLWYWLRLIKWFFGKKETRCTCGCHERRGHFHCWTGACCKNPNRLGLYFRPVRKPSKPFNPRSFVFPMIAGRPYPSLISEELVNVQPMMGAYPVFKVEGNDEE